MRNRVGCVEILLWEYTWGRTINDCFHAHDTALKANLYTVAASRVTAHQLVYKLQASCRLSCSL